METASNNQSRKRQIEPAKSYAGLGPHLSSEAVHSLRTHGFAVIDNVLNPKQVQDVRKAALHGESPSSNTSTTTSGLDFRKTVQAQTTRTDRIAWLHEDDSLPGAVRDVVLLLKGIAFELEKEIALAADTASAVEAAEAPQSGQTAEGSSGQQQQQQQQQQQRSRSTDWLVSGTHKSGGGEGTHKSTSCLEVPQRVMASVYQASIPNSTAQSTPAAASAAASAASLEANAAADRRRVGYRPHRDHAPPGDDDMYWCWKSDREQADRFVTAILYVNPPRWWEGKEEGGEAEGGCNAEEIKRSYSGHGNSNGAVVVSGGGGSPEGRPESNCGGGGGQLRLFPGADRRDTTGSSFLPSEATYDPEANPSLRAVAGDGTALPAPFESQTPKRVEGTAAGTSPQKGQEHKGGQQQRLKREVDIAPVGGRLVLFDSRKMLHAVLSVRPPPPSPLPNFPAGSAATKEQSPALSKTDAASYQGLETTATRLAFSCWVLRAD